MNVFMYGCNTIVVVVVLYVLIFWLPRIRRGTVTRRAAGDSEPRLTKAGMALVVLIIAVMILGNIYISNHPEFILFPLAKLIGAYNISFVMGVFMALVVGIGLMHFGIPLVRDESQSGDVDRATGTTTSSQERVRLALGTPVVSLLSLLAMAIVNIVWRPQQGDTTLLIVLASGAGLIGFSSMRKRNRDLRSKLWLVVAIVMAILAIYEFGLLENLGHPLASPPQVDNSPRRTHVSLSPSTSASTSPHQSAG